VKRTREKQLEATKELQHVKCETEAERGRLQQAKLESTLAVDEASALRMKAATMAQRGVQSITSPHGSAGGGASPSGDIGADGAPVGMADTHNLESGAVAVRTWALRQELQDVERQLVDTTANLDIKVCVCVDVSVSVGVGVV